MNFTKTIRKFFTNPIVLGLIIVVSIYAYFESEAEAKKIERGFQAKACADSTQRVISTIKDIIKDEDPENYLRLAKDLTDKVEFDGRLIPNNTSVTVVDTLESQPEIVQIYIHRENPTTVNPRNEYLWIWEGYICKED